MRMPGNAEELLNDVSDCSALRCIYLVCFLSGVDALPSSIEWLQGEKIFPHMSAAFRDVKDCQAVSALHILARRS